MDIILHPGAHRTASRSFQHYIRRNAGSLRAAGTAFWGPPEMRGGLLAGVVPCPGPISASWQLRRARGRVALQMAKLPDTEIVVLLHETCASVPERKLSAMTDLANPPQRHAREWLNRAPGLDALRGILAERDQNPNLLRQDTGDAWHPFTRYQRAALRDAYAEDLAWLRAGADGLAKLTENPALAGTVKTPAGEGLRRGQHDDIEAKRLA